MLQLSDLSDSERTNLFSKTEAWYRHLSESGESMTRNVANYMLVNRYIDRGDLEQAQDVLDSMPDRNAVIEDYADKLMLQVKIYMKHLCIKLHNAFALVIHIRSPGVASGAFLYLISSEPVLLVSQCLIDFLFILLHQQEAN